MRRHRKARIEEAAEENFWPSFADLTSTFVMILFVLVLLAYVQNLIFGRHLELTQHSLATTQSDLDRSQEEFRRASDKLRFLRLEVEKTAAEVAASRSQLALSAERMAQQEILLAQSRSDLTVLQTKLEGIALLRVDLLEKVKHALESKLTARTGNDAPLLSISSTGNIVIHENLVFEYNSYTLKEDGKAMLSGLAHAFAQVLADDAVRENIDVVMIQGHTDSRGSMAFNRDLSAKRANAVLDFMFAEQPLLEQKYANYFTAAAYSKARPLTAAMSEAEHEKNRRIEVAVVLKDNNVRRVIDEYMQGVVPGNPSPTEPNPQDRAPTAGDSNRLPALSDPPPVDPSPEEQ